MFVDRAEIKVKSGNGGNGVVSFRREKYVPAGGPDGGNGGRGGDVIFVVDTGLRTLMDFNYTKVFKAENGGDGSARKSSGKDGEDCIIRVPMGTVIIDAANGNVIADLSSEDAGFVAAKGGKGGKGNTEYKSSIRRAPTFAQAGFKGRERDLILELKSIADVGLLGFPNVGKSTILSSMSKAKPKIANYHFTTLKPNLGLVEVIKGKSFVMADIPGLIEGASSGVGLGHDFLRHVERTRLLIHVVDVSGSEGRHPVEDFKIIMNELKEYDEDVYNKPMVVIANKIDIVQDEEIREEFKTFIEELGLPLFEVSAVTQSGLAEAMKHVTHMLDEIPRQELFEIVEIEDDEDDVNPYLIEIEQDGDDFVLSGEGIERLMYSTDFEDYDSLRNFERVLKRRGIFDRLKEMGIRQGQTVRIFDHEFEFYD
ncbi:MAG: GTPase ObgE [Bacillota bacterium]|nr:GTPase ObgE [Bacillota bacterium]